MMQCIFIVSYVVRINGVPQGHITPSCGLCQGDPLSPYLFLICAEGLSVLIKKSVQGAFMQGVAICNGAPNLSHLFFADHSLIFFKVILAECDSLQHVLKVYEIKIRLGVQIIKKHEKYLGLPSLVGRKKKATFNDIKEKLAKKLAG